MKTVLVCQDNLTVFKVHPDLAYFSLVPLPINNLDHRDRSPISLLKSCFWVKVFVSWISVMCTLDQEKMKCAGY